MVEEPIGFEEAYKVEIKNIDAKQLQAMFIAGATALDEKKQMVNEMNVFPVPDGDTGTNMSLTIMSAAKEVEAVETVSYTSIVKAAANGSLRGARGNSGVILSQLVRGFSKGVIEADDNGEMIDTVILANAFQKGVDTAYKAVMKPKEGTILTVAREIATKALEMSLETSSINIFIENVLKHGYETLNKTPEMLPVLKEAGVVDAGGQGLLCILEGAARVIMDNLKIEIKKPVSKPKEEAFAALRAFNTEDITFGYCTEFIASREKEPFDETAFKSYLESIGDSIVVVADEEYVKVHVHTDNPGLALQKALEVGSLHNLKIENMREQHSSIFTETHSKEEEPKKELGIVSIAAGSGIAEIMTSLGATQVIEGGQTMNPSTEDILKAIRACHAEKVIVLPNNKNIILAAEQAAKIEEETEVYVLPTTTIPQGIAAMIAQDNGSPEDMEGLMEEMKDAIECVQTAQITIAVRDTTLDGENILEGEYLGMLEGSIVVHHKDLKHTFNELLKKMKEDAEVVTVYYGEGISKEVAEDYKAEAENIFEDADIELYDGKQPVYYFMISAE